MSNAARGRPAPPAADLAALWDGRAMYMTEARARATADAYPAAAGARSLRWIPRRSATPSRWFVKAITWA